jgi:hypothetical protein
MRVINYLLGGKKFFGEKSSREVECRMLSMFCCNRKKVGQLRPY